MPSPKKTIFMATSYVRRLKHYQPGIFTVESSFCRTGAKLWLRKRCITWTSSSTHGLTIFLPLLIIFSPSLHPGSPVPPIWSWFLLYCSTRCRLEGDWQKHSCASVSSVENSWDSHFSWKGLSWFLNKVKVSAAATLYVCQTLSEQCWRISPKLSRHPFFWLTDDFQANFWLFIMATLKIGRLAKHCQRHNGPRV